MIPASRKLVRHLRHLRYDVGDNVFVKPGIEHRGYSDAPNGLYIVKVYDARHYIPINKNEASYWDYEVSVYKDDDAGLLCRDNQLI